MRSLWLLTYPQRINLLRLNELRHTKDKKEKRRLTGLLLAYAAAAFVLPFYGVMLCQGLIAAGAADLMVMYACALSAALALMVSVVRGYTGLFGRHDTELLGALPFSQQAVALSRLVPMYLSALLSTLLLMGPACVYHLMIFGTTLGTVMILLALLLLTPMLPTALGVLVSAGIAWVGARFQHKNLLVTVLGVLLTAGIVLGTQVLSLRASSSADIRTIVDAVRAPLKAMYPPSVWADAALRPNGLRMLLWFALVNLLPLSLAGWVLGRHFHALYDRVMTVPRGRTAAARADTPRTALAALVKKELRGLIGRPMYLMNSAVGMWLAPIMLLAVPLFVPDMQAALDATPGMALLVRPMAPVILSFFLAMMSTTSVAVSLEGKAAWLMCTCPVAPQVIYKSKLYTYLVLAFPSVLVSAIAARILLPLTAQELLACVLLPAAVSVYMGVAGLMWDVRFRRFNFKNEIDMVKQSVQVLLTMLSGFVALLATGALVYMSGPYAAWASLACASVLTAVSWRVFQRIARKPLLLAE